MKRSKNKLEARKKFFKIANENPKAAAELLRSKAKGLENCKYSYDIVYALSEIFYLSEQTIENDLRQ